MMEVEKNFELRGYILQAYPCISSPNIPGLAAHACN